MSGGRDHQTSTPGFTMTTYTTCPDGTDPAKMHCIQLGQLYSAGITKYPERAEYNHTINGHELRLFWKSPSPREVDMVRNGQLFLSISTHGPLIMLCYKIGETPWSDCSFSHHLVPPEYRKLPDIPEKDTERHLLLIQLIDADSGIVKAVRVITMSPQHTATLSQEIRKQAQAPFDEADYKLAIDRLYAQYPDSRELAGAGKIMQAGL